MEIIYYTGRGLPPFLSSHNLKSLQLSLSHFYNSRSLFSRISLPDYTSTSSSTTYLSIRDIMNSSSTIQGHTLYTNITVPVPQNTVITIEDYVDFANSAKTDYVVSFAEEAGLQAGGKRAQRSAKNAVLALDDMLKSVKNSKVLGNIQGGKDLEARVWCANEMKTREADGLIIGGVYDKDHGKTLRNIVKSIGNALADYRKILALAGPGRPLDIVFAAECGVTRFESMWPFYLARQGKALDLNFSNYLVESKAIEDSNFNEPEIDFHDKQFEFQTGPIVPGCICQTCTSHHRGYIHHLLLVKEMTANTLLAVHNIQVYEDLLVFIEKFKTSGQLSNLYSTFVKQFCLSPLDN